MKPTKHDGILVAALLAAVLVSCGILLLVRLYANAPTVAVITIRDEEYIRLPLDTDTTVTLPTGHVVTVRDGEICVTSAPCPDLVCQKTAPARSVGNIIVCLPEKVVITVTEVTVE